MSFLQSLLIILHRLSCAKLRRQHWP